jgi:hypothetical protein
MKRRARFEAKDGAEESNMRSRLSHAHRPADCGCVSTRKTTGKPS